MSLVVAIKDKDRIVLGADKQVSTGGTKEHTNTKIWEVEELPGAIIGSVGSARASQIIQYSHVIDKNLVAGDIDTLFIVKALAPTLANSLRNNGIVVEPGDGGKCDMMPNAFIFAYKDRAWTIWHDLSVSEIEDYFAIGSGSEVARGALYATPDKNPFDRVAISIEAAAEATLYVDNGIDLLTTKIYDSDLEAMATALGLPLPKKPCVKKNTEKVSENAEN